MQLDFIDDDIRDHTLLDAKVYAALRSDCNRAPPIPAVLLFTILSTGSADNLDQKLNYNTANEIVAKYSVDPDGDENSNLEKLLDSCWRRGEFRKIRCLKILRPTPAQTNWENSNRIHIFRRLDVAYNMPFVGNAAVDFVTFLHAIDNDIIHGKFPAYAKAISVLQSSGTGKSRMLTQAGRYIFTLPICLRHPHSPGYPPSDEDVHAYFAKLTTENDMSLTAHSAIARFLAAAHETMLKWLKEEQQRNHFDGKALHEWWYSIMKQGTRRKMRRKFFAEVLDKANTIKLGPERHGISPKMPVYDIVETSLTYYERAQVAVESLLAFLASLYDKQPLCVTYFDEAHELQILFWILLRLLSHQPMTVTMWYVFLTTKPSVSYFTPAAAALLSLRLGNELRQLPAPYIALDFDQNVCKGQLDVTATIGELQSLEHLASYGRPTWKALLPEEQAGEMVRTASLKLTNGMPFDHQNKDHVLAVLSQRVCIEPVLIGSEAIGLADRSVAHHMRLISGISDDRRTFYTYSPSEPILVLAAVNNLYNTGDDKCFGQVLNTFSKHLCRSGLVEKGLTGELAARILLILARDFAAPVEHNRGRNLLKPVPLLTVIDNLFGDTFWAGTAEDRSAYDDAFGTAYANFTHWIVTKDPLPEMPDQQAQFSVKFYILLLIPSHL